MKNSYQGFYNPTDSELKDAWESNNTIFIFDTNVLLNIYSYKEKTRSDFFQSLEILNERIWLPFHVGLEYQRRRLDVVSREKAIFREVFNDLETLKKFQEKLKALEERFPDVIEPGKKLKNSMLSAINEYEKIVKKLDKNQPCVRSHDSIREKLNTFFENKVGKEPNQNDILAIEQEGESRYADKIPPGFKDVNKGEECFQYGSVKYKNKYGDLIIWKQILEYVKNNNNINNVIFITDDIKSDWWFCIDSGGKKIVGPNALLINEIKQIENVNLFHMYTTSDFLSETNKYHKEINISDSSIKETKELERKNSFGAIYDRLDALKLMEIITARTKEIERINKWSSYYDESMKKLANLDEIERLKKLTNIDKH